MLSRRCILEVARLLPVEDVLHNVVQVSSLWCEVGSSEELWRLFLPASESASEAVLRRTAKDRYRQIRQKKQRLIVLGREVVCVFDCANETWTEEVPLSRETNVNEWSAFAFLEDGAILACGGDRGAPGDPKAFCSNRAFLVRVEGATRLKDMTCSRERHGLIVFQATAYVFGGRSGDDQPLRSCESLSLGSLTTVAERDWNRLPDMFAPRFAFNPCEDGKLIYLCGGVTNAAETFYPATQTFAPLSFKLPDEAFSHCAVLIQGELMILSRQYLSRWNLRRKKMECVRHRGLRGNVSGYMNSVCIQGVIYRPSIGAILKFSLASLTESVIEAR